MPLKIPTLDDRTHADLVREGIELIPRFAPEWTNHNASDPGITLLELFAYLTEIYLYRLDRVTDANKAKFLKLLRGRGTTSHPDRPLDQQLQQAVIKLRRPSRAVSNEDFERLALDAAGDGLGGTTVVRAHCFARRNLEAPTDEERQRDWPGHVSLVFVPADPWIADAQVQSIGKTIRKRIEPRRLLTTRVHVLGPRYVDADVRIRVAPAAGDAPADIERRIRVDLKGYFGPRRHIPPHLGLPLGRSVYVSDIYRRLGAIAGVSRMIAVEFDVRDPARLLRSETGAVVGVQIKTGELFRARVTDVVFESPIDRVT